MHSIEALLRQRAEADVRFERGVPLFPRRLEGPTIAVRDVDRLVDAPPSSIANWLIAGAS
jgi:hypothetical protein